MFDSSEKVPTFASLLKKSTRLNIAGWSSW